MTLSSIRNTKNILSLLSSLFMIVMIVLRPKEVNLSIDEILIVVLLPLGVSDIMWNRWLYDGLMDDKDALYKKINFSFKSFQVFALVLVILWIITVIDMMYTYFILGIYPNL